jgi:hypothetical protein
MTKGDIPDRFVWTKIQADAGQSVDRILWRKELERQAGGTFWWGIGQAPREEKIKLLGLQPDLFFSLMPSDAHSRDSNPDGVLVWEQYIIGETCKIVPLHAVVISRAHDKNGNLKSSYDALICESSEAIPRTAGGTVDIGKLRNIGGRRIGSSQITAVVEPTPDKNGPSHLYPITARAMLVAPFAVRLTAPRLLSDRERSLLDEVSVDGKTQAVARQLRWAGLREQETVVEQDRRRTKIAIPGHIAPARHLATSDYSITPEMRHYANTGAKGHFGFSGFRAAIACLYARPEGATQAEVNKAAQGLGSSQKGYFNMLHQAKKWGHRVPIWNDQARGKVYKLIYNPNHGGPGNIAPPTAWSEMNVPKPAPAVTPTPWAD